MFCPCFLERDYFVPSLSAHVAFNGDVAALSQRHGDHFVQAHGRALEEERRRRLSYLDDRAKRIHFHSAVLSPLLVDSPQFIEAMLPPELRMALTEPSPAARLTRHASGVFSFPLFDHAICSTLLQHLDDIRVTASPSPLRDPPESGHSSRTAEVPSLLPPFLNPSAP
jgi:hypothetical protein